MDKSSEKLSTFEYAGERFADIQMLRYRLRGFEELSLKQKSYIFCLAKATLYGRDITFDQFGEYGLVIRKVLEVVYNTTKTQTDNPEAKALEIYLKRVWFSNGIYHHYGCEKFEPGFSSRFLREEMLKADASQLPLAPGQTPEMLFEQIAPVMFQPNVKPKRVNKTEGEDLVMTSACNYYQGVTQQEVEHYYAEKKAAAGDCPPSFGLNSRLEKKNGIIEENVWKIGGRYDKALRKIVYWLEEAKKYCENEEQSVVIDLLIRYYHTGDLRHFDDYSIAWVKAHQGMIDFVNGFIEVYGDPLALKASWEGIVEYKDLIATRRTQLISNNAQWFEDHSPVAPLFRKKKVKGVTANVVCAAMLGGDEYPSTAIGINLPNADWIRAQHGSKSVTIANLTEAYAQAAKGNGFKEEFVIDSNTIELINRYGDMTDDLHTDLHECLGHGSGQLLPGVDGDALKEHGNTIEEARADLYGLYYMADEKMVELGLLPDREAYKANYYTYMLNGLMTQLVRIRPGNTIEEAHMRNRALIAHWCMDHGNVMRWVKREGRTYLEITDYEALRQSIALLLAEVQRIKSEGDYPAAKELVERYAVKVDKTLHDEVLKRYEALHLAPYKGFLNPRMTATTDDKGRIIEVCIDYSETYEEQMMRYSNEYATLI
ncbi:MAG: dihydrofolate reductase [Prevotella sp.]|nr:dihydrofolate reductase [Prevotella sp.]